MHYIPLFSGLLLLVGTTATLPFTIMLDPAGDARTPGRTIDHHVERGITLELAEAIKNEIENHQDESSPLVRTVLTRVPGEAVAPLHNATFANRLEANIYLSIHCFQVTSAVSPLTIYHYLTNPITDAWASPKQLALYPYDQAHLYQLNWSKQCAEKLKSSLIATKVADVRGVYGLPFKPLVGIKVPAMAIEIGLRNKDEWARYVPSIAQSLLQLVTNE